MSGNNSAIIPRVSRVRVTVLACILIAVLIIVGWNARSFFRLNHVDFLLNQRQFDEGLALLDRVNQGVASNPRGDLLRSKALTLIGDYDAAISAADAALSAEGSSNAEALYWMAVAQFQNGQTTASQQNAARFLSTGEELPNGTIAIAGALSGESALADIPAADSSPFRMMFPVEQATYLALVAMQQAELGHFDQAGRVHERAFVLGNRNAKSLHNAAIVSALIGDVHAARMYADFAGPTTLESLRDELKLRYGQAGQAKLTLQGEDVSPGRRRVDVARALAWAESELLKENVISAQQTNETFARLLQDYSNDPVVKLCQADAFLFQGRASDALRIYKGLQDSDPTLATEIRLANLTGGGDRADLVSAVQPFLNKLNSVEVIHPDNEASRDGTPVQPIVQAISGDQPTTITLKVETRGSYLISIMGRTNNRVGKWPLLYVKSGGETVGLCYISNEDWRVYSIKILLDAGKHLVELSFYQDDLVVDNTRFEGEVQWALALVTGSSLPK